MDKRIVLLNELSHKGSWGRNQVLKLNIDTLNNQNIIETKATLSCL